MDRKTLSREDRPDQDECRTPCFSRLRRGYCKATVATAHKMIRVIYCVLKNGIVYLDPETDYEAAMVQRNAPRWIRMLKKHGIDPTRVPAAA